MMSSPVSSPAIILALGSNLGDRLANLRAALAEIESYFTVQSRSGVYETPPVYVEDQPPFLNAVVAGASALEPAALLDALKQSEQRLGRLSGLRYGPRRIDLDILFYGDHHVNLPQLTVPHPLMAEREFVLRPLADVAADRVHPASGQTTAQLLSALGTHTALRIPESLS